MLIIIVTMKKKMETSTYCLGLGSWGSWGFSKLVNKGITWVTILPIGGMICSRSLPGPPRRVSGQGLGRSGVYSRGFLCRDVSENESGLEVFSSTEVAEHWANQSGLTRPHPKWWFMYGIAPHGLKLGIEIVLNYPETDQI